MSEKRQRSDSNSSKLKTSKLIQDRLSYIVFKKILDLPLTQRQWCQYIENN